LSLCDTHSHTLCLCEPTHVFTAEYFALKMLKLSDVIGNQRRPWAQAAYTNSFMTIDAVGSFTVNTCTAAGYTLRGHVAVDVAPFASFRANASVTRHCEAPADAMEVYGHVWSANVSVPSLLMFDGAFDLFDLEAGLHTRTPVCSISIVSI